MYSCPALEVIGIFVLVEVLGALWWLLVLDILLVMMALVWMVVLQGSLGVFLVFVGLRLAILGLQLILLHCLRSGSLCLCLILVVSGVDLVLDHHWTILGLDPLLLLLIQRSVLVSCWCIANNFYGWPNVHFCHDIVLLGRCGYGL
jgi:hypothetical protein